MDIHISAIELEKQDLTVSEYLYLLLLYYGSPDKKKLFDRKYFLKDLMGNSLTVYGKEVVENILLDSNKKIPQQDSLIETATRLKEIFPKGKKEGTNLYWSDGVLLIVRRLKIFFNKFGVFDGDAIISAAQKYVNSFNGDYRYMKLLKYFIYKAAVGNDRDVELTSDLLTMLEDKGETINNTDWSTELR